MNFNMIDWFDQELEILKSRQNEDGVPLIVTFEEEFKSIIRKVLELNDNENIRMYANYLITVLERCLTLKPLSPLFGDESEWMLYEPENTETENTENTESSESSENTAESSESSENTETENTENTESTKIYINKRCPNVYRINNIIRYAEGIIFTDNKERNQYRGSVKDVHSDLEIKQFPFSPKSFSVFIRKNENNEFEIVDEEQVRIAKEYFLNETTSDF